ncbi:MAG: aminodeoxychorismate/anthranilate synthase component II [Cellvibrionaceae bacterium]|nr:aminodeoxychorismate/anthranilate synthase component II [Cellvibrionaceae bacterium]
MKILIIDNYDSFTFNLYQYVGEIIQARTESAFEKISLLVKRNNEISLGQILDYAPDRIIISPGPGSPEQTEYFGVCADVILQLGKTIPILGVCLGMQGIAHCFGGKVIKAPLPMHGKTSAIIHDQAGVFKNIPQHIEIMRYHSLMVDITALPNCLEISALVSPDELKIEEAAQEQNFTHLAHSGCEIMGVRHKDYPIEGIQFHPESFATEGSIQLLENFIYR